jgi:hypothetical protein
MPPMKPPQNSFFNPTGLSKWLERINQAGAAQDRDRRKSQISRRPKSLVEIVEELKKRRKK